MQVGAQSHAQGSIEGRPRASARSGPARCARDERRVPLPMARAIGSTCVYVLGASEATCGRARSERAGQVWSGGGELESELKGERGRVMRGAQ